MWVSKRRALLCLLGQHGTVYSPNARSSVRRANGFHLVRHDAIAWSRSAPSADASGPIATDRPAVTSSSVDVPAGSPQAENGFLETSSQGQSVLDGPELVRFGLAKRTELRFSVPDYFHNLTTSDGVGSGLGDVAIGVKQQLGPAQGFDVSVIGSSAYRPAAIPCPAAATIRDCRCRGLAVCPPTGRRQECSRRIGPLRPARRNVTGEFMFLPDRQLMKPWDAFVEYAGDSGDRSAATLATFWNSSKDHQAATD